jgi:hypothetical protein
LNGRVNTLERIVRLAIQLNAPDIADIAFNRMLDSVRKLNRADIAFLIETSLNNIAKDFPRSQIPQTLRDRMKAAGLTASTPNVGLDKYEREEMELEQALRIAENTRVFDDPKSVARNLRKVVSRVTYPLQFPAYELPPPGVGQGEMADAVQVQERYIEAWLTTIKRIVTLSIQLNAPDIADIAFNRTLQKPGHIDHGALNAALDTIAKQFPASQIPKTLKARLRKATAQ